MDADTADVRGPGSGQGAGPTRELVAVVGQ
jgi:hypothetical protein